MKISTSKVHRRGSKIQYSKNISVQFDQNLEAEVDEKVWAQISQKDDSLKNLTLEAQKEDDDEKLDLGKMKLKELQETAQEMEYPLEQWQNLKKAELVEYLTKKLEENNA